MGGCDCREAGINCSWAGGDMCAHVLRFVCLFVFVCVWVCVCFFNLIFFVAKFS